MKMSKRRWLAAMAMVVISACGGGGGGGSDGGGDPGTPPPVGLPPFTFDAAQAVTLAQSATDVGGLIQAPGIASDAAGNALVVYIDHVVEGAATTVRPMAVLVTSDGAVKSPVRLSGAADNGNASQLRVEFNRNGDALAAWRQQNAADGRLALWAALYNGQTQIWSPPRELSIDASMQVDEWHAAFAGDGKPIIVWTEHELDGPLRRTASAQLLSATPADSPSWSAPQNVYEDGGGYRDTEPRPVVLPNGTVVLATIGISIGGDVSVVLYSRAAVDQPWVAGNLVNGAPDYYLPDAPGAGVPQRLAVAADAAGRVVLTWDHKFSESHVNVFATVLEGATSLAWSPILTVDSAAPAPTSNEPFQAVSSRVAVDDSGRALIVWVRQDSAQTESSSSVVARRFDVAANSFDGPPRLLRQSAEQLTAVPLLSMSATGDAVVSWQQPLTDPTHGLLDSVFASRFDAQANVFTAATLVKNEATRPIGPAVATLLPDGAAAVVWVDGKQLRAIRSSRTSTGAQPLPQAALLQGPLP